jgi:hypothetical protein
VLLPKLAFLRLRGQLKFAARNLVGCCNLKGSRIGLRVREVILASTLTFFRKELV